MYVRTCVYPFIPLLDKCQTIAFLYIFNKRLYIFLLYMSRLSLSFFFSNGQSYRHRRGRNIYIHTLSFICNFSHIRSPSAYMYKGQTSTFAIIITVNIFKKNHRRRNIILPDMVDSTKEKQH